MQLAPKPSNDNLDLYIQMMEQQNRRHKQRLLKLGLGIGLALVISAAAVVLLTNLPLKTGKKEQITYLMFQSDYLPHREIIGFLNRDSHAVIIRGDEGAATDTLSDLAAYENWLQRKNRSRELTAGQYTATAGEVDQSDEPEVITSPLGLLIRGKLEADRPLTFSISGYRADFSYRLDFGNGRSKVVNDRYTYKYPESGNFVVKLTCSDEEGNSRSIRRRISVRLPRPVDEVLASREAAEPELPTLVITDLGPGASADENDEAENIPLDSDDDFDEFGVSDPVELEAKGTKTVAQNNRNADSLGSSEEKEIQSQLIDMSEHVFMATEVSPSFPGGKRSMRKFIAKNLKYPDKALEQNIEGKVLVQFVVKKDGQLEKPKIIQSLGHGCDEEVLKIVTQMPRWNPGLMADKPVHSAYTLPVVFELR